MQVNERECDAAGQDHERVKRLATRLKRLANECEELGITIFGGSGTGSLRGRDANMGRAYSMRGQLILAETMGPFDGGDGVASPDENDLLRGEGIMRDWPS